MVPLARRGAERRRVTHRSSQAERHAALRRTNAYTCLSNGTRSGRPTQPTYLPNNPFPTQPVRPLDVESGRIAVAKQPGRTANPAETNCYATYSDFAQTVAMSACVCWLPLPGCARHGPAVQPSDSDQRGPARPSTAQCRQDKCVASELFWETAPAPCSAAYSTTTQILK